MFIPPSGLKNKLEASSTIKSKIYLKSSHLLIDYEVASKAFGTDHNVYMIYYANQQTLMIAPVSDEVFKKLHKAGQHLLKDRNLKGDKSIALHEILIDNQIDQRDRNLEYTLQPELGILTIKL